MTTSAERFRAHMEQASAADPAVAALVVEACRIMDRLDQIDGIVTGKSEWIELMHFRTKTEAGDEITVTLDDCLGEARQQANALRGLLSQLGIGKADLSGKTAEKARDPLDDLAARRAARGGATARPGRAAGGTS
ncbi:hypothetical protein MHY85_03180 [Cellulomonas sp. ACRRI]|uniref:hypothetical protein n=1 Tax=Cellulomonas sp. ACRRI TaxID=2918188 RepID=UPI001EF20490|nr:hypothetical protein [Cellulomonas sp. ACRRI]MCG7284975.1 hypothetical protein [Cellulomonas sp. ACRRI]